jgi:hypothetical protein
VQADDSHVQDSGDTECGYDDGLGTMWVDGRRRSSRIQQKNQEKETVLGGSVFDALGSVFVNGLRRSARLIM